MVQRMRIRIIVNLESSHRSFSFQQVIRFSCILFSLALSILGWFALADETVPVEFEVPEHQRLQVITWIKDLEADSYTTRKRASEKLARYCRISETARRQFLDTLQQSIEIRQPSNATRLREFRIRVSDESRWHQLDRLTDLTVNPSDVDLSGWREFSSIVGRGWDSRQFYRRVYIRYSERMENRFGDAASNNKQFLPINLLRLQPDDGITWAFVLLCDQSIKPAQLSPMTWQLQSMLQSAGHGPLQKSANSHLVQRLISQWIRRHRFLLLPDDLIVIANRYECDEVARELCLSVLSKPMMPPATHATAILNLWMIEIRATKTLARSVDSETALEIEMQRFSSDHRVCYRQCNVTPDRKIETQVRDIVLAVRLYRHGVDPRDVGMVALQADALTVIRVDSVGFENEEARQRTFRAAETLLQPH